MYINHLLNSFLHDLCINTPLSSPRRCGYEYKSAGGAPPLLMTTLDEITDRNLRCLKKDVVGEITAVKSTVSDPPEEKNHVMVTIKLDR
ncbi:hypothetical protein F2Q69_00055140 [Brassica cretica]|uniref:Uncharacterized protein n=1 Tax=Brassica cretica TaxID=69181 RepID=A0A8S9N025_BRACR|nr:hypothetical protein F2Q69_00055140 [Brassica cretica]